MSRATFARAAGLPRAHRCLSGQNNSCPGGRFAAGCKLALKERPGRRYSTLPSIEKSCGLRPLKVHVSDLPASGTQLPVVNT